MKRIYTFFLLTLSIFLILSCGGRPGGLTDFAEMVPKFTKKLNEAVNKGTFNDLLSIFDKKCVIIINTEFNAEMFNGIEEARSYFSSIPESAVFSIGEIELIGLRAETQYTYRQKGGLVGDGIWNFKLNNMGRISEFTISPGDQKYE